MINKSQAKAVIDTLGLGDLKSVPGPGAPLGEGTVTTQQILDVVEKLRDPKSHGGIIGIAMSEGVEIETVKIIRIVMDEKILELTSK